MTRARRTLLSDESSGATSSTASRRDVERDDRRGTSRISSPKQGPLLKTGPAVGLVTEDAARSGPSIQPKRTVNEPGDEYEKEAERVADAVLRMSEPDEETDTETEKLSASGSEKPVIFRRATLESFSRPREVSLGEGTSAQSLKASSSGSDSSGPRKKGQPMGEVEKQIKTMPRRKDQNLRPVDELSASTKLLNFLKGEEGLELQPYNDPNDYCTIGYGHLIEKEECSQIDMPSEYEGGITEQKADSLFRQDVNDISSYFRPYIDVSLVQHEFDALVSFAYNTGPATVENSGIADAINNRNFDWVPELIRQYTGEEEHPGIVERRKKEARMFAYGEYP